jgi:hypothetical protein
VKNLQTGEQSGPPLPHEEWVKEQEKAHAAEAEKLKPKKPAPTHAPK